MAKVDINQLIALLLAFLNQDGGNSTGTPVPVVPVPAPAPVPAPKLRGGLTSWVEEFWHDWFRGVVDAESDWCPSGNRRFSLIMEGVQNAPPGVRARFMAEELPAGSGVQGNFVIEHVFKLGDETFIVRSDSDEGDQPFGDLAHVVRGPRWRKGFGWDVTIQFKDVAPVARKLTYFVRSAEDPSLSSTPVTFVIAGSKK